MADLRSLGSYIESRSLWSLLPEDCSDRDEARTKGRESTFRTLTVDLDQVLNNACRLSTLFMFDSDHISDSQESVYPLTKSVD